MELSKKEFEEFESIFEPQSPETIPKLEISICEGSTKATESRPSQDRSAVLSNKMGALVADGISSSLFAEQDATKIVELFKLIFESNDILSLSQVQDEVNTFQEVIKIYLNKKDRSLGTTYSFAIQCTNGQIPGFYLVSKGDSPIFVLNKSGDFTMATINSSPIFSSVINFINSEKQLPTLNPETTKQVDMIARIIQQFTTDTIVKKRLDTEFLSDGLTGYFEDLGVTPALNIFLSESQKTIPESIEKIETNLKELNSAITWLEENSPNDTRTEPTKKQKYREESRLELLNNAINNPNKSLDLKKFLDIYTSEMNVVSSTIYQRFIPVEGISIMAIFTDGVTDNLTSSQIKETLKQSDLTIEEKNLQIERLTKKSKIKPDDYTSIIIKP